MSKPNPAATALLTEHLRYTPISLIDDIINTINELIYKSVLSVEQFLDSAPPPTLGFRPAQKSTPPPPTAGASSSSGPQNNDEDEATRAMYAEAKREIEEGIHKLETLLENCVDKDFDKVEIYALRNVFSVPEDVLEWVRLRHYENLNFNPPPDAPTKDSIAQLRRKLLAAQKLHASLLRESARNDQLLAQLTTLLSPPTAKPEAQEDEAAVKTEEGSAPTALPFSFLAPLPTTTTGSGSTAQQTHLTSTTKFTTTQLPTLRAALSLLRPLLPPLSQRARDVGAVGSAPDTDAAERRIYIERQTRRHLEGVRGVRLEEGGGVRDGEWQGPGGRVGMQAVGGLEGVLGLVAGEKKVGEGEEGGDEDGEKEDEGRMDEG